MLSVEQAIAAILGEVKPRSPIDVALNDALGLTLAVDIVSDVDSPPFAKSLMDGFAVRSGDLSGSLRTLVVIEAVTAGRVPQRTVQPGQAARIMTGAPLPDGADAVVPVEQCDFTEEGEGEGEREREGGTVVVRSAVRAGTYVIPRGQSMSQGEKVLHAGTRLGAPQLGLLAEVGRATVTVWPRPTVGVLATGDELVPIEQAPGEGQIRNSNQTMLIAQVSQTAATPCPLGIARDERAHLQSKIADGLACDVLCLSGGVSAGTLDLVPAALQAAGIREVLHKVDMKPGKPVWFGKLDAERAPDGQPRWIFGLPGNPVSSMVCFELFVRTALRKLMGVDPAEPQSIPARLEVDHQTRGDRPTYFPAHFRWKPDGAVVRPVDWRGSFDLRAAADANAMIEYPAGERAYSAGKMVNVLLW
ncbi:MAG: gephyrin-like molybdotransferase Glp [Planctomycetaceae bacterium]